VEIAAKNFKFDTRVVLIFLQLPIVGIHTTL